MSKYEVENKDIQRIIRRISDFEISKTKYNVKPIAYLLIGQPASGKTRLADYVCKEIDENVVFVNNDENRYLHPNYEEIYSIYKDEANSIVSSFSSKITEGEIKKLAKAKRNLIIEGTGKNINVQINTARYLKKKGYKVIIDVIAEKPVLSKLSSCLRGIMMENTSRYTRYTSFEAQDSTIKVLPNNVDKLNECKYIDEIRIWDRNLRNLYRKGINKPSKVLIDKWQSELDVYEKEYIEFCINEIEKHEELLPHEHRKYYEWIKSNKERIKRGDQKMKDYISIPYCDNLYESKGISVKDLTDAELIAEIKNTSRNDLDSIKYEALTAEAVCRKLDYLETEVRLKVTDEEIENYLKFGSEGDYIDNDENNRKIVRKGNYIDEDPACDLFQDENLIGTVSIKDAIKWIKEDAKLIRNMKQEAMLSTDYIDSMKTGFFFNLKYQKDNRTENWNGTEACAEFSSQIINYARENKIAIEKAFDDMSETLISSITNGNSTHNSYDEYARGFLAGEVLGWPNEENIIKAIKTESLWESDKNGHYGYYQEVLNEVSIMEISVVNPKEKGIVESAKKVADLCKKLDRAGEKMAEQNLSGKAKGTVSQER